MAPICWSVERKTPQDLEMTVELAEVGKSDCGARGAFESH